MHLHFLFCVRLPLHMTTRKKAYGYFRIYDARRSIGYKKRAYCQEKMAGAAAMHNASGLYGRNEKSAKRTRYGQTAVRTEEAEG